MAEEAVAAPPVVPLTESAPVEKTEEDVSVDEEDPGKVSSDSSFQDDGPDSESSEEEEEEERKKRRAKGKPRSVIKKRVTRKAARTKPSALVRPVPTALNLHAVVPLYTPFPRNDF